MITIPPRAVHKLGTVDDDLGELDALAGCNGLGDNVDAGVEAEDKARVGPVRHKVSAGEEDFAGGGHGDGGILGDAHFEGAAT